MLLSWSRSSLTPISVRIDIRGAAMPEFPILFAYIDPGTGSYLLQLALAGLLGAGYTLRRFWSRIASFFRSPSAPIEGDGER